jgi:ATP synthase protein I
MKRFGIYLTIPFILAVPPILGWFIGSWLDAKLGTKPIFMFLLIVLGFIAAFRELYRIIKRYGNET